MREESSLGGMAEQLLGTALERGGFDNVTLVLVRRQPD
jgi:serine/threonine protein phosphatase PrpC